MNKGIPSGPHHYRNAEAHYHHGYVLPALRTALSSQKGKRICDLGSGNGYVANAIQKAGHDVTGVEPSPESVKTASASFPNVKFFQGSAYDDLAERLGRFDVVVSIDVIEHMFAPRLFTKTAKALLKPGGMLILSTPYHGYWKNLAISLVNGWDRHADPLHDDGHIKLWTERKMKQLLQENGFVQLRFSRLGRIPPLAKILFVSATLPVA
jgi:2-polyprenyl-6-hydroxyphenyl methylase/3-demethylubiquinone-9 3-methyltransferase